MSLQSDLNYNPIPYVIYYCNSPSGQNDPTLYDYQGLSNVCSWGYDGSSDFIILSWLIGGYVAPSTATLLTYTLTDVTNFMNNFYVIPNAIQMAQPYTISTANLSNVIANSTMQGYLVFDSTAHMLKFWNQGTSSWIVSGSLFVKKAGDTMTGALDMSSSNNINNVNNITQLNPSAISIWSPDTVSISFTANTPKLVPITSFTQTVNPNSDFSFTSSTGQCQYTGTPTKYFTVTINYSTTALAVSATLTNFISHNGSTTIGGQRNVTTSLLLGSALTTAYSLTDVIQLAHNDTIELAAQNSTSGNVSYQAVSYVITQL